MIQRSSEALLDLTGHLRYLRREAGEQIALRFVDSVENALNRLEQFPYLGRKRHFRQPGIRSWPVPGFRNWLLFYRPVPNGIQLFRVLHGSMELETQLGTPSES